MLNKNILVWHIFTVLFAVFVTSPRLVAQSPQSKLLEENVRKGFTSDLKWIEAAEQVPSYARFRSELVSFQNDAVRLFDDGASICARCINAHTHSRECDDAFLQQVTVAADTGALATFAEPGQTRPADDSETIRPQVERWTSHDFALSRAKLLHYASSPASWQAGIARASSFTNQAAEAAEVDDWSEALIYLRHAQLLMDTAVQQEMMKTVPAEGYVFMF